MEQLNTTLYTTLNTSPQPVSVHAQYTLRACCGPHQFLKQLEAGLSGTKSVPETKTNDVFSYKYTQYIHLNEGNAKYRYEPQYEAM